MYNERLKTKYGLILLSAGSAIGLGNVWRFPYVVGKYGGAIFVLFYLLFLVIIGIPMVNVELAIGRASSTSPKESFYALSKNNSWKKLGWLSFFGTYILMFFYTVIAGWILNYVFKFITGEINPTSDIPMNFRNMLNNPIEMLIFTILVILMCFGILSIGFNKGVENITSKMMILLLFSIFLLVINSFTLNNAMEGFKFYLIPDLNAIKEVGFFRIVYEAMNQAFFTLSIGIGSIATFGAKSTNEKSLFSSSISIILLDTFVAIMAGLIIFPATTSFSIDQKAGPGLVFIVIPEVFKHIPYGNLWGTIFFIFLAFAALSTVIATFEEMIQNYMGLFKSSRIKSILINFFVVILGSIPVILGFNVWKNFQPFGEGSVVLDIYDFLVSANLLPLGAVLMIIFVISKRGWGYEKFINEVNKGEGIKFRYNVKFYLSYILPVIVMILYVSGYILKFLK